MAVTAEQKAMADDNCADLVTVDMVDGELKLNVDGTETTLKGGYVSTDVSESEIYVYVSAWYCAKRVELVGTPKDPEPEPEPTEG